jgi:hypothetical protein
MWDTDALAASPSSWLLAPERLLHDGDELPQRSASAEPVGGAERGTRLASEHERVYCEFITLA